MHKKISESLRVLSYCWRISKQCFFSWTSFLMTDNAFNFICQQWCSFFILLMQRTWSKLKTNLPNKTLKSCYCSKLKSFAKIDGSFFTVINMNKLNFSDCYLVLFNQILFFQRSLYSKKLFCHKIQLTFHLKKLLDFGEDLSKPNIYVTD